MTPALTRSSRCLLFLGLMLLCALGLSRPASAQDAASSFDRGRAAFETGEYTEALLHLEPLFEARPTFQHPTEGAVAYWLGRAYTMQDDHERALETWHAGLEALTEAGAFDTRLADAYLSAVFGQRRQNLYVRATQVYLTLLEQAGQTLPRQAHAIVYKHVAQMAFLLPEPAQAQIIDKETYLGHGVLGLRPGAGPWLRTWWHSRDPLPATAWNERIVEHLERVATAEERYAYDYKPVGFDDRGKVYVRLGPPTRVEHIDNDYLENPGPFSETNLRPDATIIPRNEYWTYLHLGQYAHYLFIDQEGRYQLSQIADLLPKSLRGVLVPTASGSGQERAFMTLMIMHDYYHTLSFLNPDYARNYFALDQYINLSQEAAFASAAGTSPRDTVNMGRPSTLNLTLLLEPMPVAVRRMLMDNERADRALMKQREKTVPRVHTFTVSPSPLRVETRLARFLERDGTTRTELYWAAPPDALQPTATEQAQLIFQGHAATDRYVLSLTAAQKGADYQIRKRTRERHDLEPSETGPAQDLPVYAMALRGDTGTYHLAFQWDEYMVAENPDDAGGKPKFVYLKTGTLQADSLKALDANPGTLEMSDLAPLYATAGIDLDDTEARTPYPFVAITPETPLALFFEIYHLTFDADDRTRYTVEYGVTRLKKRGALASLLGRRDAETILATTPYTGSSRTAREHILLDLSTFNGEGPLAVTVRITDQNTGQTIERTLDFELKEPR